MWNPKIIRIASISFATHLKNYDFHNNILLFYSNLIVKKQSIADKPDGFNFKKTK